MHKNVEIIAEVASNFDNDLEQAKAYILAARDAGATVVKFQTLQMATLFSPTIELHSGERVRNPRLAIENLELPRDWHFVLADYANQCGVEFMSTPFYLEAVDLLEEVGVSRYKISSGDITFQPLLERVASTGKPIILSTGASYLDEVASAVKTLRANGCDDLTLLHCSSTYPPVTEELNLAAISTLRQAFPDCRIGLSDHSRGSLAPIIATSLGAAVIEKHLTLTPEAKGPDHAFATSAEEFAQMVQDVRAAVSALGDGIKEPKEKPERRVRIRRCPRDPVTGEPSNESTALWLRPAGPVSE